MLDDIRNHDARPTPEESACMENSLASVGRAVIFLAIALVVGVGASQLVNPDRPTAVAASHR